MRSLRRLATQPMKLPSQPGEKNERLTQMQLPAFYEGDLNTSQLRIGDSMKVFATLLLGSTVLFSAHSYAAPKRTDILASSPQDRHATEVLLSTYTQAVSTKSESLFESILLNKSIPFTYVADDTAKVAHGGTTNYEAFRKGVFESQPFTQSFKNVSIEQDGNLANVRLIFTNSTGTSSSWGWKKLQLLKVSGVWKIASEFYTVH